MRKTVLVSVSGGRTSGYMARWVQQNPEKVAEHIGADEVELVFVFANTGMEHPDTLRFLQDLDQHFQLGLVWLEGVTQFGQRVATKHRVVDPRDAFSVTQWRDPEHPFHSYIRKYGIPNIKFIGCTREMKLNTMGSYMRSLGFQNMKTYYSAVGIREDEPRRVRKTADIHNIIYPLVDLEPVDKEDVLDWWSQFAWDLSIPEWLGNCVGCYKKSYKKLKLVQRDFPEAFEFTQGMEDQYGGPDSRTFFRLSTSTKNLLQSFAVVGGAEKYVRMNDAGCSESCEVYPTDEPTDA